jgi:hypothetical protein
VQEVSLYDKRKTNLPFYLQVMKLPVLKDQGEFSGLNIKTLIGVLNDKIVVSDKNGNLEYLDLKRPDAYSNLKLTSGSISSTTGLPHLDQRIVKRISGDYFLSYYPSMATVAFTITFYLLGLKGSKEGFNSFVNNNDFKNQCKVALIRRQEFFNEAISLLSLEIVRTLGTEQIIKNIAKLFDLNIYNVNVRNSLSREVDSVKTYQQDSLYKVTEKMFYSFYNFNEELV